MSCYEWEAGTIRLPSAAVADVKKTVRDAANAMHAEGLRLCKEAWNGPLGKTRSVKLYQERLYQWSRNRMDTRGTSQAVTEAYYILDSLAQHPRQVQVKDLERSLPKATNRTTEFRAGEASVRFDGRDVHWSVPENNHACEWAHDHPVAKAFFNALTRVQWTRGTGGEIVGNNEYNRDSEAAGGGANYVVQTFGPKSRKPALARW